MAETGATNAAERLRRILMKLEEIPDPGATSLKDAWARVFRLGSTSDEAKLALVMQRLSAVLLLVGHVRRLVESTDDLNPELVLRHYDEIEHIFALNQNLDRDLQQLITPIRPTGRHALEMCEDLLARRYPESQIASETISDLVGQINQVLNDLLITEDLDDEVRDFIRNSLADIVAVLQNSWATGLAPVEDAQDKFIGGLQRRPGFLARLGASDAAEGVSRIIVAVDLALRMASGPLAIGGGSSPPPPPPTPVVVQVVEQLGHGTMLEGHGSHVLPTPTDIEVIDAEIVDDDPPKG